MKIIKKILKVLLIFCAIVVIGGIAGVVAERSVVPRISSWKCLERFEFLQKFNEKVTVINKTEQITVHENFSLVKTSQNVLPAVVSIIEYSDNVSTETRKVRVSEDIQDHVKTGIILSGDGLIMSVIKTDPKDQGSLVGVGEKNKKFKVLLSNGKEIEAKKTALDDYAGVEFFKIDAENLPVVQFGNSDELEAGEKVIVLGNATGEYQNTFSMGVINEKNKRFSLLNSELSSSEKMEGAIICDAKIDKKNMGGPAVDFNGTVVGIAHYIEKDGKNVGFVVPINKLRRSIERVMSGKELTSGLLGIYYLSINREISLLNDLPVNEGALVYSFSGQQGLAVKKGSAADLAGIKLGDIVISVEKEKVSLDNSLSQIISAYTKGDRINLQINRSGDIKMIEVVLK